MAEDKRPDSTLVPVRYKDHDDTVSPGVVSLGWLRQFGKDNWVEVETDAGDETDQAPAKKTTPAKP